MSDSRELTPLERERLGRAERRSVLAGGVGFAVVMAALVVSHYGAPWRWGTPDREAPWAMLVITLVVVGGVVALTVPLTRDRLRAPGPRRDLVVSGGLGDIVRVVRDLATGRPLDRPSRPIARALLATDRRRVRLALATLILGVVVVVLGTTVVTGGLWFLVLGVLYVVGSLAVLAWSVAARRHGAAQGLDG